MEALTTALTSALGNVASDVLGVFGDVLPAALTIVGAVLVVTLGIRMFRKVIR